MARFSNIQRRQEAERQRIEAFEATLKHAGREKRPPPDFVRAVEEVRSGHRHPVLRDAECWCPQMKTRDPARLRLAAARHLFARYPVPNALEQIWIDEQGMDPCDVTLRKHWYVVAARGGSLYRETAGQWLSRKEVHAFLNASDQLGFEEAFSRAIACSYTDNAGLASRIARSKLAFRPLRELGFWREAARFFCANPTPLAEIDDLCDFLRDCLAGDAGYSLKGRSLGALRRRMHEWHRDLAAIERIERARRRVAYQHGAGWRAGEVDAGRWPGSPLEDWTWQPSEKGARANRESYAVKQLCTAVELVEETRAMRHCVSTYARYCIAGHASIWSLRRTTPAKTERLLTIELDQRNRAVQLRGFANRQPSPDEMAILSRWARARAIVLP